MYKQQVIENIKNRIKNDLKGESSGHDWPHTFRVYKNSIKIAKSEAESQNIQLNFFILELSALLHDIADHKFGYTDTDREVMITDILKGEGVSSQDINEVIHIVNNVSFSKGNIPDTLEGKIVQDADRIDAIGAIGIARTFAYGGTKGREMYIPENSDGSDSIYHFYEKLLLLKDKLNTKTAYNMALERNKFMEKFLEEFYKEWNCEE